MWSIIIDSNAGTGEASVVDAQLLQYGKVSEPVNLGFDRCVMLV